MKSLWVIFAVYNFLLPTLPCTSINPLALYLILYTHLHPIGCLLEDKEVSVRQWLSSKPMILAAMASLQWKQIKQRMDMKIRLNFSEFVSWLTKIKLNENEGL